MSLPKEKNSPIACIRIRLQGRRMREALSFALITDTNETNGETGNAIYLISFFPNCMTAAPSNNANSSAATGRNGNSENVNFPNCIVAS